MCARPIPRTLSTFGSVWKTRAWGGLLTASPCCGPVIGRAANASFVVLGGAPYIPVSMGATFGRTGGFEPSMLVASMVHDEIHDVFHAWEKHSSVT